MSVLIKGMEMPETCEKCPFETWEYCRGICKIVEDIIEVDDKLSRPSWCPLIAVPPHGRLIDADAMAEDLDSDVENDQIVLDQMDFVGKERERIQFDKDCKQNCMWYLSKAPTIIPADFAEDTNVPIKEEGE